MPAAVIGFLQLIDANWVVFLLIVNLLFLVAGMFVDPNSTLLILVPALFAVAAVAELWLPVEFAALLTVYVVTSTAYSLILKRLVVLDVLTLAGLYTLRIVAGAAAIEVEPSFWLLAFSMFLFLSLALVKRHS